MFYLTVLLPVCIKISQNGGGEILHASFFMEDVFFMLTTFCEYVIGSMEGCKTLDKISRRNPALYSCKAFLDWIHLIISHPNVLRSFFGVNRKSQNYSDTALMSHWKGFVSVGKKKTWLHLKVTGKHIHS